jgi:hypothetical protein
MYSGTTLRSSSGKIAGAHQKINRLARVGLRRLGPQLPFPLTREINHFEGINGPDGLKRKSPSQDEPWHYYNPLDENDNRVIDMMADHRFNLIAALKSHDMIRASFEAAWLSHAIIDGLTPAHHYPFEEKLEEIRGEALANRTSVGKKLVYPGKTFPDKLKNNWQVWGAGGVMTTHGVYEWGVSAIISPLKYNKSCITQRDIDVLHEKGIGFLFKEAAKEIYGLDMYETYQKAGWTPLLAKQTRDELAPRLLKIVVLAWYDAALEAAR